MNERLPPHREYSLLHSEHRREAIRSRLLSPQGHSYLGHAILGAIDGGVTTFAIVSAAVGGGLSNTVVIMMGFANLLADAFSMAVSNYQGVKTQHGEVERARRTEHRHIEHVPGGEREEIRQIFAAKGFEGELLERVVDVITSDRNVWVDTMLTEELGIQPVTHSPIRAALSTFAAFLLVGAVPLLPFLVPAGNGSDRFMVAAAAAAVAFFAVGAFRGRMLEQPVVRGGLTTLAAGGAAAAVAYFVSWWLKQTL